MGVVAPVIPLVTGGITSWATRLFGNVSPTLSRFATEARQRAIALERASDVSAAQQARALAAWLSALTVKYPHLPRAWFEEHYTPFQVARIIEARFSGDSDEWELDKWLAASDEPWDNSPAEARRIAVLTRARSIMKGIDHRIALTFEQRSRVVELIEELKQTPPAV